MKILAIDPATKTGWCTPTASGMVDFKLRSNESKGMKFIKFRSKIKELIEADDIELVVYEKPVQGQYNATRSGANFEGVILTLCEDFNLEYRDYSPHEIKRFAKVTWQEKTNKLHKGHMKKNHMLQYARDCFDFEIIDDNHADAVWLYHLAISEL